MKPFAYFGYNPHTTYIKLAAKLDIELIPIGVKRTADVTPDFLNKHELGPFQGAVVFNPSHAMELCTQYPIGIFETTIEYNRKTDTHENSVTFKLYDVT